MKDVDCTSINQYRIDNAMSDTESDFDTEELEREFDDVLVQLTSIQEIQEDALLRLERLQHLQCAQRGLTISVDGVEREWNEVIDELHIDALRNIRESGKNTFGTMIKSLCGY